LVLGRGHAHRATTSLDHSEGRNFYFEVTPRIWAPLAYLPAAKGIFPGGSMAMIPSPCACFARNGFGQTPAVERVEKRMRVS
jgi:hypothetical protein